MNCEKHHISFEEAATAFYDTEAIVIADPAHSECEERFILLGFSVMARLLMVCHCIWGEDNIIRIISARKATRAENEQYTEMEGWVNMQKNYDFSKGIKNPYAAQLKKQAIINIDASIAEYFKKQEKQTGISYQRLINM